MNGSEPIVESLTRSQRRRLRNREALITAARGLFATNGFEGTGIADIAEAADLGFGTVYLYFPSKDAILEAVLEEGVREITQALEEQDIDCLPPAEALEAVSERFIRLVRSHRDALALMGQMRVGRRGSRPLAELLTRLFERIINRGVEDGSFRVHNPRLAARAVTGMHIQLLFSPEPERDGDELVETIPPLALGGLRGAGRVRRQDP